MAGIEHTAEVTVLVNKLVGAPVATLLQAIGVHHDPHMPIPNHVAGTWVVMLGLAAFSYFAGKRLQKTPRGLQNVLELFMEFIYSLADDVIGHKGRRYVPLLATQAVFIAVGSAIGLVPFFSSPTASLCTTAALGLVVFVFYNAEGIRAHGLGAYLAHFAGPKLAWYMFPIRMLMVPIELVSHCARPFSLALRLFANIFGDDVILVILFGLVGLFVIPVQPLMFLAIFKAFVQAYIFVMLTSVYLGGAVAEEEH
ncbi:MAG: F0F1 ATP synthase subunit A [Candidatus Schekmanbacteria bacterium]|nr:F0F1 ATP synthase subunit A [Candidatus Schekmanbacteria bacterium]